MGRRAHSFPEARMRTTTLLILGAFLVWPQDTDEAKKSLAAVKKADGKIIFDDNAPGRPVISVDL